MRYYIIVGEASGDLHGANLMKGLLEADPSAEFRFWGGDRMAAVGGEKNLARHYKTASFFGLSEVIANIRTIFRQMSECRADVVEYTPDVLILIDYPGFNLKMARFAKGVGIRTFYYISPKVWAWKESRVKNIRKYVDQLFIIFPFEIEYFRKRGIEAIYEGNPLADVVEQQLSELPLRAEFVASQGLSADRPIVALLCGSRRSEVQFNLPFMVNLAGQFPDYQFVVGGVSWLDRGLYDQIIGSSDVKYVRDQTYPLLAYSQAAIVTSGTATLETALIGTPEIVCYRGSALTMWVGRILVKVRFLSLVNLILDREVVPELIQQEMNMVNAKAKLNSILPGGNKRETMLADFELLRQAVGGAGASRRFATRMVEMLKKEKR